MAGLIAHLTSLSPHPSSCNATTDIKAPAEFFSHRSLIMHVESYITNAPPTLNHYRILLTYLIYKPGFFATLTSFELVKYWGVWEYRRRRRHRHNQPLPHFNYVLMERGHITFLYLHTKAALHSGMSCKPTIRHRWRSGTETLFNHVSSGYNIIPWFTLLLTYGLWNLNCFAIFVTHSATFNHINRGWQSLAYLCWMWLNRKRNGCKASNSWCAMCLMGSWLGVALATLADMPGVIVNPSIIALQLYTLLALHPNLRQLCAGYQE